MSAVRETSKLSDGIAFEDIGVDQDRPSGGLDGKPRLMQNLASVCVTPIAISTVPIDHVHQPQRCIPTNRFVNCPDSRLDGMFRSVDADDNWRGGCGGIHADLF